MDGHPLILPQAPAVVRAVNLDTIRPWREAIQENWRLPYWKARQERFRERQDAMRKGILPLVPALLTLKNAPLVCAFNQGAVVSGDAADYTFAGISTGTANPLRWNVVGISGSYANTPSDVTLGGASLTNIITWGPQGLGIVHNPTGTSATIFIDGSGANLRAGIVCYSITGLLKGNTLDSSLGSASSPSAFTIKTAKGGCVVGVARLSASAGTVSGATEDYDTVMEGSSRIYGYSVTNPVDNAALSITITSSSSTVLHGVGSWSA